MASQVFAIVTAAGRSSRMREQAATTKDKMLLELGGAPVLARTLQVFESCSRIDQILVTTNDDQVSAFENLCNQFGIKKVARIVRGGAERQDSVFEAIKQLRSMDAGDDDIVCIHNGANPLLTGVELIQCIEAAEEHGASVAAFRAKDTVKEVDQQQFVVKTLDRSKLWQMQTPQTIRVGLARRAFEAAMAAGFYGTDDVQLVERLGLPVKIVPCSYENIKITSPSDLLVADALLRARAINEMM